MKIIGIEHIGIAVKELAAEAPFWKYILKMRALGKEALPEQGVETDIYDTGKGKVELLEPLGADSTLNKFMKKRGPGLHHVCFEVEDINEAIKELKENDIELISEFPRMGAEGFKVIFIHPRCAGGVLVELAQKS
ncbi:MAG: methylmalonyl-CoA epimerase [Candidatus Neomarinimicrobiota bacterium]